LHINTSGTQSVPKITNGRALPNHVPFSSDFFIWATIMEVCDDPPDDCEYMEENDPVKNLVLIFAAPLLHRLQELGSE